MTDDPEKRADDGVRRVTSRERKRRIEAHDLSFPPDSLPPETLWKPDADDTQPYDQVSERDVEQAPPANPPPSMRPRRRAPAGERYPPVPGEPDAGRRQRGKNRSQPTAKTRHWSWRDAVALLFLLGTLVVGGYFVYIWFNPYSPLNPLSPPVPAPLVVSETPMPSVTPSPTASPTRRPTATFTPLPAEQVGIGGASSPIGTPDLTQTLMAGTPSATPPPPPFALLRTGVVFTTSVQGCNYLGIAGSVVDFEGRPLDGYGIWITGENIDTRLTSGSDNLYGAGGFLLQVGDTPQILPFAVQVLSADGTTPLSEPYTFLTRDACEYNVALVRFVQVGDLPG